MTRDVVTALVSLGAMLAAVAYLAVPSSPALALEVRAVAGAAEAKGRVVIYGRVRDAAGKPVRGAVVTVSHTAGRRTVTDLRLVSGADGTFRKVARIPARRYVIAVSVRSGGKKVTASRKVTLRPGHAYAVEARKKRGGGFTLIPVRGY